VSDVLSTIEGNFTGSVIGIETTSGVNNEYGSNYAIINLSSVQGILRGGFYVSGDDAGIYAQYISLPLYFKAPGVGFCCVKSL
jgi:hypothetical protein